MSDLRQLAPARAKQKIMTPAEDLVQLRGKQYFAEEKKDGLRELLHCSPSANRITSRRQSVKDGLFVEKTPNVPHIRDLRTPAGWIIDGEVVSRWGETSHQQCANTVSVMGSNEYNALALQKRHGWNTFEVFDVLFADGKDVRLFALKDRLKLLEAFLEMTYEATERDDEYTFKYGKAQDHFFRMRSTKPGEDFTGFYESIMEECGEGIIIKDLTKPYNHARAWFKWKHRFTMDVVLLGNYEPAKFGVTGKFYGMGGAFYFGLYKGGKLVPIGKCSGMDDATRLEMTKLADSKQLGGKVVQISGYEVTKAGLIRNPNFDCWRPDKIPAECTYENQLEVAKRW